MVVWRFGIISDNGFVVSHDIGVSTNVVAKLWALRDGLSLASFMVFSDFIVELDALVKIHPNLSLHVDDYVSISDNPWSQ